MRTALELARPRDDGDRQIIAELGGPDGYDRSCRDIGVQVFTSFSAQGFSDWLPRARIAQKWVAVLRAKYASIVHARSDIRVATGRNSPGTYPAACPQRGRPRPQK